MGRIIVEGQAIVDNKRYVVAKAKEIGSFFFDGGPDEWFHETLYLTDKGRYFLVGKGAAYANARFMRYSPEHARYIEDDLMSDKEKENLEELIPMDAAKALNWAQKYLDIDQYEEYFKDLIEDA